jgi:hypothetical protein
MIGAPYSNPILSVGSLAIVKYCEQSPSETPCSFNQVFSVILSTKSPEHLYQMATSENRVGSKQRGREREKESSGLTE